MNAAQKLQQFGTSVWYDNISREIIKNGELKRLISEWGVRGLTSNPTIFNQALAKGAAYDAQIEGLKSKKLTPDQVFTELALVDIGDAADLLRPVFDQSKGNDGFVSIEVSPLLARDTQGSVQEAIRLYERLNRPNIMIKVPGTKEGIPAIFALLEKGINVNITLLFSLENYLTVAKTYCDALRARSKAGQSIAQVRSVASFFVSRVDSAVDARLAEIIKETETKKPEVAEKAKGFLGRFAIANSRLVYKHFKEIFLGDAFKDLREKGAEVQRPLWASTGTKNPKYRDVVYCEQLVGQHTVNTMPHETLASFVDHGQVAETLSKDMQFVETAIGELKGMGVDVPGILEDLQVQGVQKFADSFRELNDTIAKKL